jgi:hypothetical protein
MGKRRNVTHSLMQLTSSTEKMIEFVTKVYDRICSKVDYKLTDEERDHIIQFAVDKEDKWLLVLEKGSATEKNKYAYFHQIVKGKIYSLLHKKHKQK